MFVAWFQEGASREYLNGASSKPPGRHQIQNAEGPVLDPCAKQIYFRRDPKVDPLRIESGPSWRACFWSLHFVRCAEALQAACVQNVKLEATYTNSIRGGNLELGRPVFACLIFLDFFGPKNRPFWMTGRVKAVQTTTSWTPELSTSDKMKGPKTGPPGGTTFDPKRVHFWVPSDICFAQGSKTGPSAFWIWYLPESLFDAPFKYYLEARCWNQATNISATHDSNYKGGSHRVSKKSADFRY